MATTFMGLTLPLVSQTPGPEWASTINSDLSLIDSHNHTSGFGAPITTAALSIDADLDLNGFGLTTVSSLGLRVPSTPPTTSSVYSDSVGDLYYTNSAGQPVRITNGPNIVGSGGTISGMTGTNASVAFTVGTSTFTFQSDANKPANIDSGPITVRRNSVGSYGVVIQPASGGTGNWNLFLPNADPGATRLMGIVSGGQVGYVSTNSTLTLTGSSLTVATGGITSTQIAAGAVGATQLASNAVVTTKITDGNVTQAKLGPKTVSQTSVITSQSTASTTPVTVVGSALSFSARSSHYVSVEFVPALGGVSGFECLGGTGLIELWVIDSLGTYSFGSMLLGSQITTPRSISCLYSPPSTGTSTFYAEWSVVSATSISANYVKLIAYET